jgi:hypothetical protein
MTGGRFVIGDTVAQAGRALPMLVVDIDPEDGGVACAWKACGMGTCERDKPRERVCRPSALRLLAPSPLRVDLLP